MHKHKGWTEEQIREAIRRTSPRVRDVLAFVAAHPECTSADIAVGLGLKSHRSVGPTLNGLTRTAREMGVSDGGTVRWFFEWPGKTDGWDRYDFPAWVRAIVQEELGAQ